MEQTSQTSDLPTVVLTAAAAEPDPITRRPYCRRSQAAWAAIRQLFEAGATAKALAEEYGGTERTIYARSRKHGWRRKDQPEAPPPLEGGSTGAAARDEALRLSLDAADQLVRALPEGAGLAETARATMLTSLRHVRRADPARAYSWARLAGQYERLERGMLGSGAADGRAGGAEDPTEPGRRAALDFLREKLGLTSPPGAARVPPHEGEGDR